MKILAIGNSFSEDAMRYLQRIAESDRYPLQAINLMIGGCSLARHYRNLLSGEKAYGLQQNGCATGFSVSLQEALLTQEYDVVTLQQVSHDAPRFETYEPYLSVLAQEIRKCQPKAKLFLHMTWAYEDGSTRLQKELGYTSRADMYADLVKAYTQAAQCIHADGIIPSAAAMQESLARGITQVHRDGFHAGLGYGRYLIGLVWYGALTGRTVVGNPFRNFDEPVSEEAVAIAQLSAQAALRANG